MFDFLTRQLDMPPTDRLAHAFLKHDAADSGARGLGAYDEFLGLLGDDDFRRELGEVTRAGAEKSAAYEQTRTLGRNLEAGLLALLFETSSLPKLVRDYAIF